MSLKTPNHEQLINLGLLETSGSPTVKAADLLELHEKFRTTYE
jgi:hypothetical protein